MRTYNEIVDDLESLEKKEATDISGLDTRVTSLEQGGVEVPVFYEHHIIMNNSSAITFNLVIINTSEAPFTFGLLYVYLNSKGYTDISSRFIGNGHNENVPFYGIYANATLGKLIGVGFSVTNGSEITYTWPSITIIDKVVPINPAE